MSTPINQTREVLVPNNGSTVDQQPTVHVSLSEPLGTNQSLVLYVNGVATIAAPTQLSATEYEFVPRCNPGVYAFRVDVVQTDGNNTTGTSPSNVANVVVESINQAWSAVINQDGPYALGNSGSSDPFADFNWEDSFWIAVIGNLKGTDVVEWNQTWTPGSDGYHPPTLVVHPADANNPWRLEVKAHSGNGGYSSGVLEIELVVNGSVRGDKLQLVLNDEPYGYEGATWAVWVAPMPNPFSDVGAFYQDAGNIVEVIPNAGIWYITRDGATNYTAKVLLQLATGGAQPSLQAGDIVVLQGVMQSGTPTGVSSIYYRTGDANTNQLHYIDINNPPAGFTFQEHQNNGDQLQYNGELGLTNWTQNCSDLGIDPSVPWRTFTIRLPDDAVQADGYVKFGFAYELTLTSQDLQNYPQSQLTSLINGVAVYRGGTSIGNQIFSVKKQVVGVILDTEVRDLPSGIVAGFTSSGNWETNLQQSYTFRIENQSVDTAATSVQTTIEFGPGFAIDGVNTQNGEGVSIDSQTGLTVFRNTSVAPGDSIFIEVLGYYSTPGQKTITVSATPNVGYPAENTSDNTATAYVTVVDPVAAPTAIQLTTNTSGLAIPNTHLSWYVFTLIQTSNVTIDTIAGSDGDTMLGLYASNGNLIQADDDSGGNLKSRIVRSLSPGTYYIAAGRYPMSFNNAFTVGGSASGGNIAISLTVDTWATVPKYIVRVDNTSQGTPWYIQNMVGSSPNWTNTVPPQPSTTDVQNAQITQSSGNAHDWGSSANAQLVADAINANASVASTYYFGSGTTTATVVQV